MWVVNSQAWSPEGAFVIIQLSSENNVSQVFHVAKKTTLITLHHNYNSTTLQLQLQLQYITLHTAVVGEVTTATITTIPANTTPTTFRSISGFALPSLIHNNQLLL